MSVISTGYTCGLCMESHGHLSTPENVRNVSNRCHNFDFSVNYWILGACTPDSMCAFAPSPPSPLPQQPCYTIVWWIDLLWKGFCEKYLGEEEKLGLSVSKSLSLKFTHVVNKRLRRTTDGYQKVRHKQTWCWGALKACLYRTLWRAKERELPHGNQIPDTKYMYFPRFVSARQWHLV